MDWFSPELSRGAPASDASTALDSPDQIKAQLRAEIDEIVRRHDPVFCAEKLSKLEVDPDKYTIDDPLYQKDVTKPTTAADIGQDLLEILLPGLLRLHDSDSGEIRGLARKYALELISKAKKAKEVIFVLEQAIVDAACGGSSSSSTSGLDGLQLSGSAQADDEDVADAISRKSDREYSWATRGLIAEFIVRQLRVLPATRFRSRVVCNSLPHTTRMFDAAPAHIKLKHLAKPAFLLAKCLVPNEDGVGTTNCDNGGEDLLPAQLLTDAVNVFVFALLERTATEGMGTFGKELVFERRNAAAPTIPGGLTPSGSASSSSIRRQYPGLSSAVSASDLHQACQAVGYLPFADRPSVIARRTTQSGSEHEVTPLGLASFVYVAECHAETLGKLLGGGGTGGGSAVAVEDGNGEEKLCAGDGGATGSSEDAPLKKLKVEEESAGDLITNESPEVLPVVEKAFTIPSYLPRIFSTEKRFLYLRDACDTLLVHRKYAAAFHMLDSVVLPMGNAVFSQLTEGVAPALWRPNIVQFLLPPIFYVEILCALAAAVPDATSTQRGIASCTGGSAAGVRQAYEKATALPMSAAGNKDEDRNPSVASAVARSVAASAVAARANQKHPTTAVLDVPPPSDADIADNATRTALFRDLERTLKQWSTVATEGAALQARFDHHYFYALKSERVRKDLCVLASIVSTCKDDLWQEFLRLENSKPDETSCAHVALASCGKLGAEFMKLVLEDIFEGCEYSLADFSDVLSYMLNFLRLWYSKRRMDALEGFFGGATALRKLQEQRADARKLVDKIAAKADLESRMASKDQSKIGQMTFLLGQVRDVLSGR
eukprot:g6921.t1